MRTFVILRAVLISTAFCLGFSLFTLSARGQDVGADVGGGAGIFRAKNPETKRANKPGTPGTKPSSKTPSRSTRATSASVADRVEELLDKGNQFRDSRRFAESEESYQGVLKLRPRDARAAYGLGNIYSDQQRWENAESAYRNAVQWAPGDVDALVALSVVLVQPRVAGDNAPPPSTMWLPTVRSHPSTRAV